VKALLALKKGLAESWRLNVGSQTVLGLFKKNTEEYFSSCRVTAVRICRARGHVTSDDVQVYHPRPQYVSRNSMSQLFRHVDFVRVGTVQSTRPGAKGHYIGVYKLSEPPHVEHDHGD